LFGSPLDTPRGGAIRQAEAVRSAIRICLTGRGGKKVREKADADGFIGAGFFIARANGAVAAGLGKIAFPGAILLAIDIGLASVADLFPASEG
jgi:hypothetical protein